MKKLQIFWPKFHQINYQDMLLKNGLKYMMNQMDIIMLTNMLGLKHHS